MDIAGLTNTTLFLTVLLMLVGAGAASTGGENLQILDVGCAAPLRVDSIRRRHANQPVPTHHPRRNHRPCDGSSNVVPRGDGRSALTFLLVIEQSRRSHTRSGRGLFLDALFEVALALGTVGVSIGMTGSISDTRTIGSSSCSCFWDDSGRIPVFVAVSSIEQRSSIECANEEPLDGLTSRSMLTEAKTSTWEVQ